MDFTYYFYEHCLLNKKLLSQFHLFEPTFLIMAIDSVSGAIVCKGVFLWAFCG